MNKKIVLGCLALVIMGIITLSLAGFFGVKAFKKVANSDQEARRLLKEKGYYLDTCLEAHVLAVNECAQTNISCLTGLTFSTQACVSKLASRVAICEEIPKSSQLIDGPKWAEKQCRRFGATDLELCQTTVFKNFSKFCPF